MLRGAAFAIVLAGLLDPTTAVSRRAPVPVEIRLGDCDPEERIEAARVRDRLLSSLGGTVRADGAEDPVALIAVGDARLDSVNDVQVFSISLSRTSQLRAIAAPAVIGTMAQRLRVSATFRAQGGRGRKSTFVLSAGDVRLGQISHTWTGDDETFAARFAYLPLATGLTTFRISGALDDGRTAAVDVPVLIRDRRHRVFVFEARPAWTTSFVRQALERHQIFETGTISRTSPATSTHTSGMTSSLSSLDLSRVDSIVVSGLEALSAADLARLKEFVVTRGGTLVLAPDAQIPEPVRGAFELPLMSETLLERPIEVRFGEARVLASELLLAPVESSIRSVGVVRHAGADRAASFVAHRGNGQIIVWGALDAWRFRGNGSQEFTEAWQSLVADGALAAPPRIAVEIEPAIARPGQPVVVRARVRETEWTRTASGIALPALSAQLVPASGYAVDLRLWPAPSAGEFVARVPAPQKGKYTVQIAATGGVFDAPLIVDDNVLGPHRDRTRELRQLARITGGASTDESNLAPVLERLGRLARPSTTEIIRPMRSAWWIVPLTVVLSTEWILRRRRGLR